MMTIKTPEDIEIMAEGGRRLAAVLRELVDRTAVGVTTKQLDRIAYRKIHELGAKPAFLNYRPAGARRGYPYTLCASLNEVVVHGQPSDGPLGDGDLLKLDLGLVYHGWYLDAAVTVLVESPATAGGPAASPAERERRVIARKLMDATREALQAGIAETRPGKTLGDVGFAIEQAVKRRGFAVAEGLIGHGIGRTLHEDPPVFNFGRRGSGELIEAGMVIAIEPMVVAGRSGATVTRKDDSFASRDGLPAAHFEHTVAVTPAGPRVLTEES